MAEETQDGQKTIVAFVVGLLIGGLLVWAFSGPTSEAPSTNTGEATTSQSAGTQDENEEAVPSTSEGTDTETGAISQPELQVGDGAVIVNDQAASASITLESATYPVSEGWIGVREYNNEQLGYILGVVRFSESQGLVPDAIALQRSTNAGTRYAVVIFTEDGDFEFNLAGDVQIDTIFDTFVAK